MAVSEEKLEEYWKVIRGRERKRDCKIDGGETVFPLLLTFSQAFDMAVALNNVASPGNSYPFEFRSVAGKWSLKVQGSGVADITAPSKEEAVSQFIHRIRDNIDGVINRKVSEAHRLLDEAEALESKLKEAIRSCLLPQGIEEDC